MYMYTYISIFLIYVDAIAVPFASRITYCYLFCTVRCRRRKNTHTRANVTLSRAEQQISQ